MRRSIFRQPPRQPQKGHQPVHPVHPVHPVPPVHHHPPASFLPVVDHGPTPFVVNLGRVTEDNHNYRTTLWTGDNLQLTLMSIPPKGDIGLERHKDNDQFLRIESGHGIVQMGRTKDKPDMKQPVFADYAIFVPAGTWHNIINIGETPLKIYSIYAPPHHPHGTIDYTKESQH